MFRQQRVLVALSGLEVDGELLAYARRLTTFDVAGCVKFVHVVKPDATSSMVDEAREKIAWRVRQHYDDESAFSGATTTESTSSDHSIAIVPGVRTDALIDEATKSNADVILIGHRRNRSGHRSLARRLAMAAPCSVWLVPEGAPGTIRRVLAPVDFSDHSAEALRIAAGIAKSASALECTALHVSFDPMVVGYDEHVQEMHSDEKSHFAEFLAALGMGGESVRVQCEDGPEPSRTIVRIADDRQSDLIVMSTRGRSRAAAVLLGSVTARVIERSPISVLAVKHSGAFLGLLDVLKQASLWTAPNPKTN